jgi:RNA polymerase sigma factor (sigma-70 family)
MDLAYGVCLKYLKDPETSKDAVMAIFEELLVKLKKHEVSQFRGWFYTLVKNHCLMQLRSGKSIKISPLDEAHMQFSEESHLKGIFEKEQRLHQLGDCINSLSNEQRKAVELFYLKEKCYKDIVEISGMEYNTIRSLIQNGRRNLRICMEQKTAAIPAKKIL